jgi:hypothetical protein
VAKKPKTSLTKDEVNIWHQRLERSRKWRQPEEEKWKRYIRFAKGKFFDQATNTDQIAVNLVHPHIRIIIPSIYSKNPDIMVVARQKKWVEQAKVMERLLRYLIHELGLKEEMKTCLLDAILIGHSWMKTGYQTDFEKEDTEQPLVKKVFDQLKAALSGDQSGYSEESTYYLQPDERIVSERPWALRVSPFDVTVPALSSNRHDLPWISHMTVRRLQDVKDTPYFKNTSDLKPSSRATEVLLNRSGKARRAAESYSSDPMDEYVIIEEIWDCSEGCIYTLAEDHPDALEVKPNEYTFLDSRHPFEMLGFNFIPDVFYPLSEIEPWEPQLHELNDIRTQQCIHRKRYNRRYVYVEGEFTPAALEQLQNGEDGALIPTTAEDARAAVVPVQDANLPTDVYQTEQNIKRDITTIGGITDYQRGSAAQGAKSATEASIVEAHSNLRSEERLDVVSTFAQRIIRNLGMICQNFMDQEQVFPIVGDDAILWAKVDKKAIQGEMMFGVVYGSSAAVNRDVEKQQILQAYEMLAQDPLYDPIKVRSEFLRKVLGVVDPASWLRKDIAAMMKQAEEQAIQDAMANGGPAIPGQGRPAPGNGNGPGPGVGQVADRMGAIRRSLQTRTPGGVGGGMMNQ